MKKKFIGLIFCCFVYCLSFAQKQQWDSTYRPPAYYSRLALFKSYPHSGKDIVFLGNSITQGVDWNELLQLPFARNRGISGDITNGVLQRLDEVINGYPAKVFILIGINDIGRNIPDSIIIANHRAIIKRIKEGSPRTSIFIQSLMPVNNQFTQHPTHYNKDEHIARINKAIRKLALKENIHFIDLYPFFLDDEGRLKKELTMDGLHLNAAGYSTCARILRPYVE